MFIAASSHHLLLGVVTSRRSAAVHAPTQSLLPYLHTFKLRHNVSFSSIRDKEYYKTRVMYLHLNSIVIETV